MLEITNISKSYGDVKAIRELSFTAKKGQITTLLGANGCGKTTTLRAIAGLITPDQGSIMLNGYDVQKDTITARQHLGIFPDVFGLYPRLTTV
ncbi:MAG: ATP-binding cassette domain-containing protein, partial [Emcibacteraceae bacterium]|nr:ATP-binding cassette domain-containing protein [Emcibacteraceae bacterium]